MLDLFWLFELAEAVQHTYLLDLFWLFELVETVHRVKREVCPPRPLCWSSFHQLYCRQSSWRQYQTIRYGIPTVPRCRYTLCTHIVCIKILHKLKRHYMSSHLPTVGGDRSTVTPSVRNKILYKTKETLRPSHLSTLSVLPAFCR